MSSDRGMTSLFITILEIEIKDMDIKPSSCSSDKVDYILLPGNLAGNTSIALQDYFEYCIDNNRLYQLINMKNACQVDSLGVRVLCDFIYRGLELRLFNVEPQIRMTIKMAGKYDIVKIYNETVADKAVLKFENEISDKRTTSESKSRQNKRVNTDFNVNFKINLAHDRVVSACAMIKNLSQGGLLADNVAAIIENEMEELLLSNLEGKQLYDFKFDLGDKAGVITTSGVCVRNGSNDDRQWAGVKFDQVDKVTTDKINDYVNDYARNDSDHIRLRQNIW